MRLSGLVLAIPMVLTAAAGPVAAQTPAAQLMVGGGSATDVRGVTSNAITAAPTLTVAWPRGVFRLGATGTRFTTGSWSLGGGASGYLRAPIAASPLALTIDAAASATTTSYHASFTTISATPAAELGLSRLALFAGVRATQGRTTLERVTLPMRPVSSAVTRGSVGPVFGGRLVLVTSGAGDRVSLGYREDRARVDSVRVTDRAGTLSLARGPVSVTGTLGLRRAPDEETTFGGVSAVVALSRVVALQLGAERYPSDRLTGTLAGHAISAGLVLRTRSGPRPLPEPRGVSKPARGMTRVAIRAPDARTVEVAGDWTHWQLVPADRAANGVWYVDVALPPGEYRYAFRIDGRQWQVPDGAVATDDGVSGKSAWLTVSRATE